MEAWEAGAVLEACVIIERPDSGVDDGGVGLIVLGD